MEKTCKPVLFGYIFRRVSRQDLVFKGMKINLKGVNCESTHQKTTICGTAADL
jgi:hypothetical protein